MAAQWKKVLILVTPKHDRFSNTIPVQQLPTKETLIHP